MSFLMDVLKSLACLCLILDTIESKSSSSLTKDQQKRFSDHFVSYGANCLATYPVTSDDLQALLNYHVPKDKNAACFFDCVLKKAGLYDNNGKLASEKVLNVAKEVYDNEKELEAVVSVFQDCEYVNDLEVTDGDNGCDRAKYVLACLMDDSKEAAVEFSGKLTSDMKSMKVEMRQSLRQIIQGVLIKLIKLACLGISKQFLPGRIIHQLLPGLETLSSLCAFVI